jgi:hypothetical protein
MFHDKTKSQAARLGMGGVAVWATVATIAGTGHAPMGVIELMLLFATLVMAPLALELAREVGSGYQTRFGAGVRVFQPFAAIATVAAFWLRPGMLSAVLCAPWLLLSFAVALDGLTRLARSKSRSLADIAIAVAGVDLVFASGWLVVSRAGLRPMGFQEPIVLLTAVHFHYIGFATAVLAAGALHLFESYHFERRLLSPVVSLALVLPFVLALGFVVSPMLRMVVAVALAVDVMAFAGLLLWLSRGLVERTARVFLRFSGAAVWIAMVMAGVYAVTDHIGRPFLTMPGMASTHGVLNGLGFVLLGTLAFLIEVEARTVQDASESVILRKQPSGVRSAIPEFVAREFYDR